MRHADRDPEGAAGARNGPCSATSVRRAPPAIRWFSPLLTRRTDPWRAGENEIVDRPAATARDPDRAIARSPARRARSRLPSPRTPSPRRSAAEYEATLRAKIAEEKAKLPPRPNICPRFRIISSRAQARVADGTFHDHYSRAYRKLTETREEYASVAATLREARGKERADAEATMNAEAHAGWELHAKMGDEAHERALDRWEAQRERWEALKRAHALRFDKRPGDLAMERLDEHRRKMEIFSHLDMAAPVHEREGGAEWEWKMSLRNNWMRYVAVGNVFSELYYFRDELAFADPVHVRRAVNPEDGASYSSARGRSVLASEHMAARRRRLRRRLRNLLPGELDDEDVGMLEVVGEGMANLAEARARKRITFEDLEEQIAKDSVETWAAIQKRRADDRAATETRRATAAAAKEAREIARLAALGPHCELGAERINATSVAGTSTRVSATLVNTGTTALFYSFSRAEHRRLPHAKGNGADVFFLAEREGSVMPGESREIVWTFKAPAAGVYHDVWRLETRPRLRAGEKPPVTLRGVATVEDANSFPRRAIAAELARKEMVSKVRQAVGHVMKGIVTPSPERRVATKPAAPAAGREPALFRAGNRERRPRVYYHEEAFAALWNIRARAREASDLLPPTVSEEEKEEETAGNAEAENGEDPDPAASADAASSAGVPPPPPWGTGTDPSRPWRRRSTTWRRGWTPTRTGRCPRRRRRLRRRRRNLRRLWTNLLHASTRPRRWRRAARTSRRRRVRRRFRRRARTFSRLAWRRRFSSRWRMWSPRIGARFANTNRGLNPRRPNPRRTPRTTTRRRPANRTQTDLRPRNHPGRLCIVVNSRTRWRGCSGRRWTRSRLA